MGMCINKNKGEKSTSLGENKRLKTRIVDDILVIGKHFHLKVSLGT